MSQVTARINLSAKTFPFIAQNWGRTILVPQYDTNFSRQVVSPADQDHDVGIPQAYYCHNVMPHAQGFQAVGYNSVIDGVHGQTFIKIYPLSDSIGNFAYFGVAQSGNLYVIEPGGSWTLKGITAKSFPFYTAYCSGVTYIWQQEVGYYIYDWSSHTLVGPTVFSALDVNNVIGITASYGYLIAWTGPNPASGFTGAIVIGGLTIDIPPFVGPVHSHDGFVGAVITNATLAPNTVITSWTGPDGAGHYTVGISQPAIGTNAAAVFVIQPTAGGVFWSSTIDPTDFVPSLITGAGGGRVEQAIGKLNICVAHTKGFFIYTDNNCVIALFSNNSRYPFAFQAIVGSGGVSDLSLVTFDANTNLHYAYTTAGLQLIGINAASTVFPEITDFISGKLFEDFDETTNAFTLTPLTVTMKKHIQVISSRYLVVSYGMVRLTHALVVDLISQRLGKLKIDHIDCIELSPSVTGVTEVARENIGFVQSDGTVQVVDFSEYAGPNGRSNGVLIIGKFQFIRARLLVLESVILENIPDPTTFSLQIMTALYGKSYTLSTPYLNKQDDTQQEYLTRVEGVNHSLLIKGQFHIESGVLVFTVGGKR